MSRLPPPPPPDRDGTQPIRPVTERIPMPPPGTPPAYGRPQRLASTARRGFYLPAWSILLMLGTVVVVAGIIIGGVIVLGGNIAPQQPPQIIIVTAPPTATPEGGIVPTPTTALAPSISVPGALPIFALEGPTLPPVVLTPTPRQVTIGATVAVTEDDVRLRPEPGVDNQEIELLRMGMLFRVIGGPEMANSMAWWQVEDISDPTRRGWISGLYLTLP